jgi:putative FmdB family regulatory protein
MPIFEYQCAKCGHQFEYLVLPTSPAATCPKCKSRKLSQQISLFAVNSDSTHALAMKAAKKRDKKQAEEKGRADSEYRQKHTDD